MRETSKAVNYSEDGKYDEQASGDDGGDDGGSRPVSGSSAASSSKSARQLGDSLVGTRLSVWWEDDEAWYDGTVRGFSDALGEHLIRYDDGEQRQEALDTCRWKRLTATSASASTQRQRKCTDLPRRGKQGREQGR